MPLNLSFSNSRFHAQRKVASPSVLNMRGFTFSATAVVDWGIPMVALGPRLPSILMLVDFRWN